MDFDLLVAYLKYIGFVVAFKIVGSFLMYFELEMGIVVAYQKLVTQLGVPLIERVFDIVE